MLIYPKPRMPMTSVTQSQGGPGPAQSGMGAQHPKPTGQQMQQTPQGQKPSVTGMPGQAPQSQGPQPANRGPAMGPGVQRSAPQLGAAVQQAKIMNAGPQSQWGKVQDRSGHGGWAGAGQGGWEQSYNVASKENRVNQALHNLPPGTRGADIQQQKPGANLGAAVSNLGAQMQSATSMAQTPKYDLINGGLSEKGRQQAAYDQRTGKGAMVAPPESPTQGAQALGSAVFGTAQQLVNQTATPTGPAGVATGRGGLTAAPSPAPAPAQSQAQLQGFDTGTAVSNAPASNLLPEDAEDKNSRAWDDYYDQKYEDTTKVPQAERDRVANLGYGATFDEDVASDWGWKENDDGTWEDHKGNTWTEDNGVLTRTDNRAGYKDGLPQNIQEGQVYYSEDGESRFVYHNGERIDLQPGQNVEDVLAQRDGKDPDADPQWKTDLANTLATEMPTMDRSGVEAQKKANDRAFAAKSADAMRAGLVASARGGMSAESQSSMLTQTANQSGIANQQANAAAEMQHAQQNFQAQMKAFDAKLRAIEMAAQFAQSDKEREWLNLQARELMYAKADLDRQMGEYEARRNAPSGADIALGVASAAAPVAGGALGALG